MERVKLRNVDDEFLYLGFFASTIKMSAWIQSSVKEQKRADYSEWHSLGRSYLDELQMPCPDGCYDTDEGENLESREKLEIFVIKP